MKKITTLIFFGFTIINCAAQNIGIATTTPGGKLQINHKNTGSSPSLILFDSTAGTGSKLLFTKQSQGNTFSLLSTIDVFAANSSLDMRTTFNSGIFLRGDGRVGINNITSPAATLHVGGGTKINDTLHVVKGVKMEDTLNVGGDINIEGKLRINGATGNANQVLVSNGNSGNPTWQDMTPVPPGFQNFETFEASGGINAWIPPVGVTKILIEGWSGGGSAGLNHYGEYVNSRGGGSGGYFKAIINLAPGQQLRWHVPSAQANSNFNDKDSISVQLFPIVGLNDKLVVQNGDSAAAGRKIRATGIFSGAIFINGNNGGYSTEVVSFQKALGIQNVFEENFYYWVLANGGNAPMGGNGGIGAYKKFSKVFSLIVITQLHDIVPGTAGITPGGGGAISRNADDTPLNTIGGDGRLIIYY